jgi:hypothetical protein
MIQNERVKLRTACDACTRHKVRCDGQAPCARCVKSKSECFFRPVKRPASTQLRRAHDSGTMKAAKKELGPPELRDDDVSGQLLAVAKRQGSSCLDEHERRTWTVFFSMYKKFGRGCSSFWFKVQLSKMERFLALKENSAALERLRGWMDALGIASEDVSQVCTMPPHISATDTSPQPTVHRSADELRAEAVHKHIPMVEVDSTGGCRVSDAFESTFGVTQADMNNLLQASGGGFLPFFGDVMARLLSRESDLLTYVQVVALSFDALGKPEFFPMARSFPTSHVFRVSPSASVTEQWVVVKCVHWQHVSEDKKFTASFLATFDMTAPEVPQRAPGQASFALRDKQLSLEEEDELISENMPYIASKDLLGDDETWLENILTWVDDEVEPGALALPDLDMLDVLPLEDSAVGKR